MHCSDSLKPVHVLVAFNRPEDWRCVVYRYGKPVAQGRGRTEQHAAQAGAQDYRRSMRLERDERARLALSFRAAQAEFVASYEAALRGNLPK